MLHVAWFRSQPSVHFLQWFGLRAQTKSRLHIIRIFLSSFCYYLHTRHSNFSLRWWEGNIISLGLTILDYGRGHNIYPGCNVLVLTECSCSLFPGQCRWHGPGSWQGVMTVSRKCEDVMLSRIINRHLWCLLVSQHCILSSWHLPTSTLKWGDKIQDPFLPKYLYQSVCPPDSCYC